MRTGTEGGSDPRRQHYNPCLLQRGFATERKRGKFQTYVFDKQTDRSFPSAVENVAAERDFNTIDIGDVTISWESKLTYIENLAAPVIAKIRANRSLADLTDMERGALCVFAAAQLTRGPDWRARYMDMGRAIREKLIAIEGEDNVPPHLLDDPDDTDARRSSLHMLQHSLSDFADQFAIKNLMLFEVPTKSPFLLGDCPVVMDNRKTFGPYGNLGLAVSGIEIYLPISFNFSLGFWCPSHLDAIRASVERSEAGLRSRGATALLADQAAREAVTATAEVMRAALVRPKAILHAFEAGTPLLCDSDNVMHMNSLQVKNAERFVMSKTNDFSLVRRMIADNEKFRGGQRLRMG